MDDLDNTLNNAGIGCHVTNGCAKHVLCVIASSPCSLQASLNICSKYGFENILYNLIKSICIVVKPHGYQLKCPDVYLNNNKLEYAEKPNI